VLKDIEESKASAQAILFTVKSDGILANFGHSATLGAELAHKEYGQDFELIEESEGDGALYNRVSHFGRVKAAVGHMLESSLLENAPYYRRYGIPVLLPFLDNWETGSLGPNFYQLAPDVPAQARVMAERTLKAPSRKLSKVVILETDAEPFKLLADTYVSTLKDPSSLTTGKNKRRPLSSRVKVLRYPLKNISELPAILSENKLGPQDIVVLALSNRDALQAAPYFLESNFQKAIFLGGNALANRDLALAFLSANLNLELLVPLDLRNTKNPTLNKFVGLYRARNKQDPTWPSVLAYDAITMAITANSAPNGTMYLSDPESEPTGLAGSYLFAKRKVPSELVKVTRDSSVYYP
jgi:ABC-type branched-subunit amino acid transport system substrate-binding protein